MTTPLHTLAIRHAEEASRLCGTPRVSPARNEATLALTYAMLDQAAAIRALTERLIERLGPVSISITTPPLPDPPVIVAKYERVQAHIDAGGCL